MLAIGTHDGLYRATDRPFEEPDPTLECGTVHAVESAGTAGLLAATDDGLYRSRDGRRWDDLDVPRDPVVSVAVSPDGAHCYAGTYPAHVYRAPLDGSGSITAAWTECEAFRRLPDRERWADRSPRDRGSQVRTLAVHPDSPDRVVAGLEVGGVSISDDRGETWVDRSTGLHDDVHHVLARSPEAFLAACGNGLYRSADAGRTWVRVDTDFRDFWFNYFREAVSHDGTVYTSAYGWGPAEGEGAAFAVDDGTLTRLPFPRADSAFVLSWAADGGRLLAGTMRASESFRQHAPADVLAYEDGEWTTLGTVPAGVKSLAVHPAAEGSR